MSWRENYRPGTFRGVPFHTESHEQGGGRRVDLKEYPGRDDPYAEDQGRRARTYSIEVYILGDDYLEKAESLTRALEEAGPGTLLHPYLGSLQVAVQRFMRRERRNDGGIVTFAIEFVEAGANRNPAGEIDTAAAVSESADNVIQVSETQFAAAFSVEGQPAFVSAAAADMVQSFVAQIEQGTASLVSTLDDGAALAASITSLATNVTGLIRNPLALAQSGFSLLGTVGSIGTPPLRSMTVLSDIVDFGSRFAPVAATTLARVAELGNQQAFTSLLRSGAIAEMARVATRIRFESRDDATAIRDIVSDRLDGEINAAGDRFDDSAFSSLSRLQASVVRDLTSRGTSLVPLVSRRLASTAPALTVAYDLYEDASRELEIISRNKLFAPGFVSGADPIEVLAE